MYIDNLEPYYSEFHDAWFFYDETGDTMGPYKTQKEAQKQMDAYGYWITHGPTLWQRFWWPIRYGRAATWLASLKSAASR